MCKLILLSLSLTSIANADYLDRIFFAPPSDCKVTEATGESEVFKDATVEFLDGASGGTAVLTLTGSPGRIAYQYGITSRTRTKLIATLPGEKAERYLTLTVKMDEKNKVLGGTHKSYMPNYPKNPVYQGTFTFTCK